MGKGPSFPYLLTGGRKGGEGRPVGRLPVKKREICSVSSARKKFPRLRGGKKIIHISIQENKESWVGSRIPMVEHARGKKTCGRNGRWGKSSLVFDSGGRCKQLGKKKEKQIFTLEERKISEKRSWKVCTKKGMEGIGTNWGGGGQ